MYAVFQLGGKQYRAAEGDRIRVERLPQAVGETVEIDRVLMVSDGEQLNLGRPTLSGAKVTAQVVDRNKGKKIIVFDYRPNGKRHAVKAGHRQDYTWLQVEKIVSG